MARAGATAARLTESYRTSQARVAGAAAGRALLAFRALLDPSALDRSFPTYVAAAGLILQNARSEAAALGGAYYATHRTASGVTGPRVVIAYANPLPLEQVTASLLFTGPITVKRNLARGNELPAALQAAEAATAGAFYRHTANAGRDTILNTARRDPRALGWARVTDGSPCAFCAMLASRGAVYQSESTAGDAYHDRCGCFAAPVYSTDDEIPGRGDEFAGLWAESTAGKSGTDAIRAFRQAYETDPA